MLDFNFLYTLNQLDKLYENKTTEARIIIKEDLNPINLSKSRMVKSDVVDSRGELEASAVVMYSPDNVTEPVLTRIAAYVMIIKKTSDGIMFLARPKKRRLPGGGFDKNKDKTLIDTIKREVKEEVGVKLKDIKEVHATWHAEKKMGFEQGWVNKHIANEEDRHRGYYEAYFIAKYDGEVGGDTEEADNFGWYPISSAEKSVSTNKIIYEKALQAGYLD